MTRWLECSERARASQPTISDFDFPIPEKGRGGAADARRDLPPVGRSQRPTIGHSRWPASCVSIFRYAVRRVDIDRAGRAAAVRFLIDACTTKRKERPDA